MTYSVTRTGRDSPWAWAQPYQRWWIRPQPVWRLGVVAPSRSPPALQLDDRCAKTCRWRWLSYHRRLFFFGRPARRFQVDEGGRAARARRHAGRHAPPRAGVRRPEARGLAVALANRAAPAADGRAYGGHGAGRSARRSCSSRRRGRAANTFAVLFTEQIMEVVFNFCEAASSCSTAASDRPGAPAEVRANPRVREVYLGMLEARRPQRRLRAAPRAVRRPSWPRAGGKSSPPRPQRRGKSTTLKTLMGLIRPFSGRSCHFDGRAFERLGSLRGRPRRPWLCSPRPAHFHGLDRWRRKLEVAASRRAKPSPAWSPEKLFSVPRAAALQGRRAPTCRAASSKMLCMRARWGGETRKRILLRRAFPKGLAPMIVEQVERAIPELKRAGVCVLLSEQNLSFARRVADRAMCSSRDRSVRLMRPERYAWLSVAAALANDRV